MPNNPLIKTPVIVPLYAGLQSEIADKLVQIGSGVLELDNMIASVTGEMSKRDGSTDLTIPTTPVFPAGTALPNLFELSTYRTELIRLSVPGPNPLWSYLYHEGQWLNPGAATSTVTSLFRGPIVTSLTNLVDSVTVNASTQCPDVAAVSAYGLEAHEQYSFSTNTSLGVIETIVDCQSLKPVLVTNRDQSFRPKCVAVGIYLLCFFLDLSDGTVRVDLYDTTSIGSLAGQYVLTSAGVINSASLLEVTLKNTTTATAAYTDTSGVVSAIDFVPSTAVITLYALHTAATATFTANSALAWVQDFGSSGKLALAVGSSAGVLVHWGFGAISGSVSTATADYTLDTSFGVQSAATSQALGLWNLAAYTTSNSATGEFVVMYDVLATAYSATSIVYRVTRTGSTINPVSAYWQGTSLASKFYRPGDGGTYILTSFSNTENPTTPQNTYFVCCDDGVTAQPVPLATIAPQAAGGISQRSSSLSSVVIDPSTGNTLAAISSLVDVQYVGGTPVQLFGVQLLQIQSLGQQDITTSKPVEAFGSLLVPGGTLMAYDGRTYAEAVFSNRPEPPKLLPVNIPQASPITITHSVTDQVIGAPVQPLAASKYDVVMGAAVPLIHNTSDTVSVSGGTTTYNFLNWVSTLLSNLDSRSLNETLIGGTLTVASSGIAGNDGSFTITSVFPNGTDLQVKVTTTTQSSGAMGSSTTASVISPKPGQFTFSAPGIPVITDDPTFKNQNLVITGNPAVNFNLGTFVLDGTHPCGSTTLNGLPYFKFYSSASASTANFEEYYTFLPSLSLQLANPSTANQWTFTNATFDNTYVGAILTVTNALNPSNNGQFLILSVISSTVIVTSAPLGTFGGIIRNEFLGVTAGVTAVVTPANNIGIGSHAYVAVYSCLDANNRKWRSPPSLPVSVTTSANFPGVTAIIQCLNFTGRNCMIELYRSQTGQGAVFNLVASVPNNPKTGFAIINDSYSDSQIAKQEELFTDGGILPGTPLPGVSIIASHQGRIFAVSPENPQSLFYSNPDDSGSSGGGDGLLFDTTNLSLDIIDVHGAITAIQPMDQTLIVFKKDAVYAVSGAGPDGAGQNGGYFAQLIASGVGCSNPKSIALQVGSGTQSDGVWFQSNSKRAGIFTVTRGNTVEYTGAGVRRYSSETIVSTIVYPGLSQIRWYTLSGRTLVWDWISKIWSTNLGQPCLSTIIYQDVPTYAPSGTLNGYILQEIPGYYSEGESATFHTYIPYQTTLASPWLSIAQLKGYQRVYKVQGIGRTVGAHTLTANMYGDYNDTNLIGTYTKDFDGSTTQWDWEISPSVQKVDTVKIVLIGSDLSGASAGTAGFACTGIRLIIGIKKGSNKLPDSATMAGG